jgi:hypothetical protein
VRLILLFFGFVTAGAAAMAAGALPPPNQILQAMFGMRGETARITNVNANPLASYNMVLPQIIRGTKVENRGLHGSTVTPPSGGLRALTTAAVTPDAIGQNGFEADALSQIQQNNLRLQNITAFARDAAH